MKAELRLGNEQIQRVSPKQITALRLLGYTNAELKSIIEEENLSNPFAEIVYPEPEKENHPFTVKRSEAGARDRVSHRISELADDMPDRKPITPEELVLEQLDPGNYSNGEWVLLCRILTFMDDDGYLRYTPEELGKMTGALPENAERLIAGIKKLEPAGIGAYDLAECLLLQLNAGEENALSAEIVMHHLEDMANGRYGRIALTLNVSRESVRSACTRIKRLNPKPLNGLTGMPAPAIVPDLLLSAGEDGLTLSLNDAWIGILKRNDELSCFQTGELSEEEEKYVKERKEHLSRIMSGIEYRRSTVLKVAQFLTDRQKMFLLHGKEKAPVTMTETAEALGLSISTVSRAVKAKYVQTPFGTYSLKELFSGALQQETGTVSADCLSARIREIIREESTEKPYSDLKIAETLRQQGIKAARRTVAKYRERMGIPCASLRKEI